MDGRNCTGRTISLLNDSSNPDTTDLSAPAKFPPPGLVAHSRSPSSCASTPSLSPETPHLVRSSSSESRALATPSPITPSAPFDAPAHPQSAAPPRQQYFLFNTAYVKMDPLAPSLYPLPPDAAAAVPYPAPPHMHPDLHYPLPQQQQHQLPAPPTPAPQPALTQQIPGRTSNSPGSEPSRVSTVSAASNAKSQPKKNQYPCPLAKAYHCNDFFTTSGHAARHAKKHTGKKDAFCPDCNKAFTRKDNMEQHRRTHQNGRGASRSANDDSKVKKTTKQSAKKPAKADAQFEAAVEQELSNQAQQGVVTVSAEQVQPGTIRPPPEPAMMIPPITQPYFMNVIDNGPIPSLPMAMPDMSAMRPPLHRASMTNSLEFAPGSATLVDADLPYSYPSPNLSNGLDSLVLAADAHRRIAKEESLSRSPKSESP